MNVAQLSLLFSTESVEHPQTSGTAGDTSAQIRELLDGFDGEPSLKHLFWELLSYDRVRDPLPLSILPPSAFNFATSLELFAATEGFAIILAVVRRFPDGGRLEQMVWAVQRSIGNCVVLLTDSSTWTMIYPDETLKPRVRMLPLPGPKHQQAEIVQALVALNAANDESGEGLTPFELLGNLGTEFPGPTPNIGDVLTDFDRIAEHQNPELRELWGFIRLAGQYPLLTAAEERGEDLTGLEVVPDGTALPYQQWRLVVHNLRLVLWMASKIPRVGLSLSDLVQEGCIGLITASRRFDPNRGWRFTTMAYWWVRQNILRELHNKCNLIRWPVHRAEKILPIVIQGKEQGLSTGEKPLKALEGGLQRRLWRLSLGNCNPIDSLTLFQARLALDEVLSELKPQQRLVIERRYGIGSGEEETLESIGQDLGLTRERIRQIEEKAMERLQHYLFAPLTPHWSALKWRRSCTPDDASASAAPPFREFVQSLYDHRSES